MPFAEVAVNAPLRAGDRVFTYAVPPDLMSRIQVGTAVRVPFGRYSTIGVVVGFSDVSPHAMKLIESIDDRMRPLPAELVALARWIADHYVCTVGEAIHAMLPPRAGLGRSSRGGGARWIIAASADLPAQEDQLGIIDRLADHPQARIAVIGGDARFAAYAAALQWAVSHQVGVIFLVPEVAQAERLVEWLRRRVTTRVAVLHGNLEAAARWDLWRRIESGDVNLVVGTRLAVFAPVRELGLIIVDKEEDTSYKEERSAPHYVAARVAEHRATMAHARLVWGSPTPSLDGVQAIADGRVTGFHIAPAARPVIAIVDVRAETGWLGGVFSRRLYQSLARTLPKDRAMVFAPHRGYADFLLCHECGAVPRCPRCDVAMTYHVGAIRLQCHLCAEEAIVPDTCPVCHGAHIRPHGVGTERVAAQAHRLFRGTPVLRLDTDVAPDEQAQQRIWKQFAGLGGLLVGTSLLVKGVGQVPAAVVGVVGVDTALHLPDFRAAERTYQILEQLAALTQKEMIIQTFTPSHPALVAIARRDPSSFYQRELAGRQRLGYPPFRTLVNIVVTGAERNAVREAAERLATALRDYAEVLGPSAAPLARIKGRYRWQLLVKEQEQGVARQQLATLLTTMSLPKSVRLMVDVDPVDLL